MLAYRILHTKTYITKCIFTFISLLLRRNCSTELNDYKACITMLRRVNMYQIKIHTRKTKKVADRDIFVK